MKTLIHIWLLTSLMYLPILPCMAQQSKALNHFDANIGLSTADATNVGVRYNFKQNSIGINIGGGIPSRQAWQIISSVSVYRHLWGNSKFTEVMPWYLKAGVHFDYSESQLTPGRTQAVRQAGARLYLGRDFNLSSRLGCSAAMGPMLIFFYEWYNNYKYGPRLHPGLDLMVFYRL